MAQIRFIILSSILTALTAAEKKKFCKCIETRKFKEMGLQSISWDGDKEVLLFTEPEFNFYSLIEEKQGLTFMDIASARVGSIAKRDKYNRAIAYVKDQTVKATYMFRLDHDGRQGQKHIILLVTNKGTLSGNFKDAAWNVVQPNGEELPDFSLASFPKQEMRLTGFVIYSAKTGYITLSQFEVYWEESRIVGLPSPMGKELKRPLFYLEVGDNPEEVFVVHSSIQPDLHGQLLSSVPRTFLFGEHLLLYDSANGCVFIIKDIASFDLVTADRESSKKKKHVFKRTNVPFESYFKCGMTPPFNEKRCDIVKGNTVKETTIAPAGLSFSKVVVICLGIAFLAVALLYALKLSNKKRRSLSNRKSNPNRKLQGQSQVGFSAKSTTCLPSCTSTTVFSPNSCKISRDGNAKSSAFEIAMISKGNVTVKTLQTLKRAFSKSRQ